MTDLGDFDLNKSGSVIIDYHFSLWGTGICFECEYLLANDLIYEIHFLDCTNISWEINSPDRVTDVEADIIFLDFGKSEHGMPASIHTSIFTVEVNYGELRVIKKWDRD